MWTDYFKNLKALLQDLVARQIHWLQKSIAIVSLWEVAFVIILALNYIVLFWGWRSYEIEFVQASGSLPYTESIITNDFFVFFILLTISLLPPILYLLFQNCQCQQRLLQFRAVILSLITILYIANIIWRGRIAHTPIAHFTFAFYTFGALLLLAWIVGIKAIQNYQRRIKKEEVSLITEATSSFSAKTKTEKKRQ